VEGGKGRIDAPRGLSLARFVFLYMAVLNRGVGCPIPSVIYGGSFLASSLNVLVQGMCVSTKIPRSVVFVDLRGPETSARVVCCCTSHAL
jgi:hypothetical protein